MLDASVATILDVDNVSQVFSTGSGEARAPVLSDVSMRMKTGEIVALLGRSGSGKSTLLRLIAGLTRPTQGTVKIGGELVVGPAKEVAMVFQSFALFPWLDVLDNVEIGPRSNGVPLDETRKRALKAIDTIGLDGFESAYPKELSGGMRQRVGFARALVMQPKILLMDEPFSALDVLTAENLRTELMSLWEGGQFPTKGICIVTHNIEEAVQLADRVIVLGANPGRIRAEVPVTLDRPRDRRSPAYAALVDQLYDLLTGRVSDEPEVAGTRATPTAKPLPVVSVGGLAGLVEIVYAWGGQVDLPDIANELNFEIDDLLPLVDAAVMLGLLTVEGGDLLLTDTGKEFTTADIQHSKEIFAEQAREHAPLVRTIWRALNSSQDGSLREGFFLDLLRRGFSSSDAQQQLDTAIDWGRYGELFDYDSDSGQITIDPSAAEHPRLRAS